MNPGLAGLRAQIDTAARYVNLGGIIAYPTEAVFGLGCDPYNHDALMKIAALKGREHNKGFIVVAATFEQLLLLLQPLDRELESRILEDWPGPVTWVLPAADNLDPLLTGGRDTIAVRVSDHPIVKKLCDKLNSAIVSTSANLSGHNEFRSADDVIAYFGDALDFVVRGAVGSNETPTDIFDGASLKQIR